MYLNIELWHGEELCCADSCERGHGGRSCRVLSCGAAHEQLGLEQALQLLREVGEAHLLAGILQARVQALHRFQGTVSRDFLLQHESSSSKSLKLYLGSFQFFSKIRGHIRKKS